MCNLQDKQMIAGWGTFGEPQRGHRPMLSGVNSRYRLWPRVKGEMLVDMNKNFSELPRRKRTGHQEAQTPRTFAAERRGIGPTRNKWIKVTTICCFALWFSGCASLTKRSAAPNPPNDSPLPQFILGTWESIDVQSSKSVSSDIRYAITFDRELLVNIIVIYPSGGTEGYTFGYEFIDHDTIHVNNI